MTVQVIEKRRRSAAEVQGRPARIADQRCRRVAARLRQSRYDTKQPLGGDVGRKAARRLRGQHLWYAAEDAVRGGIPRIIGLRALSQHTSYAAEPATRGGRRIVERCGRGRR